MSDLRERLRSCVTLGDVEWAVKHLDSQAARIAELEAALALRTGADHDPDCKAKRGKLCNCGHDQARRALETKP